MASNECQYCYYWKGDYKTTKADCDKTGDIKNIMTIVIAENSQKNRL